ncbi:hypothetical protein COY62_03375 [bacterium (Candidatus Howlettbacteria) CG_4_10_14_0_8_um_filter_40_9]|nr:MAG: hypothetical protein COY62_03375 [bacterium (Candidatus Howlettbacteria) CG_4_10_14_0_8_um_filter_40_9]
MQDLILISKKLNISSLIFHLLIPVLFLGAIFFTSEQTSFTISVLRIATFIAPLGIAYYFIFKKIAEKDIYLALFGLLTIFSLYLTILVDLTGGATSQFLIIFYPLLVVGYLISIPAGAFSTSIIFLYIFLDILLYKKTEIIGSPITLLPTISSFALLSLLLLLIGINYRKNKSENQQIAGMTEKLSADKNQEEAILASITDGIYAVDSERNLVLFNEAAAEMTGWDEKSALGLKCWNVMKLKNDQDISVCEKDCPMLQVWNTGENLVRDDLSFVDKKKKTVQISGAYSPIKSSGGKNTGGVCVFRDVTKRKEVERLRSEFISTASHELRTPITTLEGYIDLASNEKVSKIDDKAKEFLGKAHTTVINMSILIKNLLSVTKIDEGRVETNIENFDISELIETTVGEMRPQADKKGVKLEFSKSSISESGKKALARSVNVSADQSMIKEVLNNLLENAIKFTFKGSIEIKISFDNDFATVAIEDTGVGIPADAAKHLFEKFYQVDNTATREVGGTGLGLYITRSIVEMLGGRIWVESKVDKGTKFYFTIPRALI